MWPPAEGLPVIPTPIKKMLAHPKKKRKRNPCEENPRNHFSLRTTGVQMTCTQYFQQGHNRRGCKNQAATRAPKPKGKPGRPKKVSTSSEASTSVEEAGTVFGRMPPERRTIFIPPRPSTSSRAQGRQKKELTYTQESQT